MAMWIRACVETYDALLVVEPKRRQLLEAQEKLKLAEAKLAEKQAQLRAGIITLSKCWICFKSWKMSIIPPGKKKRI